MNADPAFRPTGALLTDAFRSATDLLRGEVDLARAEVEENLRKTARAALLYALAIALGIVALNLLAGAGTAFLVASGLSPTAAALIVAAILIAAAALFIAYAKSALKSTSLMPRRAVKNLRRDAQSIKEALK